MMEYKQLSGKVKIPVLGLGTWRMGGEMRTDRSNDKKYLDAISYALKRGITHIDTAEIYGHGHAEELVGESIKKIDRKKLFITTKVWPLHLFSANQIKKACQNSLKRLGTNYVDLYLVHWPNPLASMKTIMGAFDELVSEGKVKYIGVSNFSLSQLKNAQKHAKRKIVCNQVHYSFLHRDPEKGLLEFCQKNNIILTAYSPLEIGELAHNQSDALKKIAEKYKKTLIQVALRWLIEKPNVITIPKASTKEHIGELLGSLGWKMQKEDQLFLSNPF